MAIPDSNKDVKLAAVKRYQPVTIKKLLLSIGFRVLIQTGLDRIFTEKKRDPLAYIAGSMIENIYEYLCNVLRVDYINVVIMWPPQMERNRVYVHVMDDSNTPIGFAKIAFDKENTLLIEQENNTTKNLKTYNFKYSYLPSVINYGSFDYFSCLVLEPIPKTTHKAMLTCNDMKRIIEEYSVGKKIIAAEDLFNLKWWATYVKKSDAFTSFNTDIIKSISKGIEVCRVHGDFGQHNMVKVGEIIWLYDWEYSCAHGPIKTDILKMWLGVKRVLIKRKPRQALQLLKNQFGANSNLASRNHLVQAMAYLIAMGYEEAFWLAENW